MTIPYTLSGSPGELTARALAMRREWYAVVDGALVPELAGRLRGFGLLHRALYIEGADEAAVTNGPYLVSLPAEHGIPRLMSITGDGPSPVFWSWDGPEESIYRHLRRKAMVQIPLDDGRKPPWEPVLFRHADPNVLATVLPVLTREQQASFLGRAAELLFWAPDAIGLVHVHRPATLPPVERETLRLTPEQYAAIEANRVVRNRRRVMSYLRRVAPKVVGGWGDEKLWRWVCEAEETGREVGLRTERGQWLWAYLFVLTERSVALEREVRELMREGDNPDHGLQELMHGLAKAFEKRAA